MSGFEYTYIIEYGPARSLFSVNPHSSTWPDWDNDEKYEEGDIGLFERPYLGTVTINGVLCPVFEGRNLTKELLFLVFYSGPAVPIEELPQSIPAPKNEVFYFDSNVDPETGDGVQGVFVALFGRPADPAGLEYFNTATNNGADLSAIGDLASTQEYQDRFSGMNNEQIVASIYQSLFDRDPETAGLAYFVDALGSGTLSINNIAIAIFDGASGADKTIIDNKIAAADAFTAELDTSTEIAAYAGNDAAAYVRSWLDGVTNTVPSESEVAEVISALVSGEAAVTASQANGYHDATSSPTVGTTGNAAVGDVYLA